jgi:hypothetical protein
MNAEFNQKGTSGVKSDTCQRSESRTTPTGGHTVQLLDESGEKRTLRLLGRLERPSKSPHKLYYTEGCSLRLQSRFLTYIPVPAVSSIR